MKKVLSIILTILMLVSLVPVTFAAEVESDGNKTTLDISTGDIVIKTGFVTVNGVTQDPDPDGYIITGTSNNKDTALQIYNDSSENVTYDLVFDNLSITAMMYATATIIHATGGDITLNIECKGTNAIKPYNIRRLQ